MLFGSYGEPNMTPIRLTVQLSDSMSLTCGCDRIAQHVGWPGQLVKAYAGCIFQTLKSRLVAGFSGTGLVYFW